MILVPGDDFVQPFSDRFLESAEVVFSKVLRPSEFLACRGVAFVHFGIRIRALNWAGRIHWPSPTSGKSDKALHSSAIGWAPRLPIPCLRAGTLRCVRAIGFELSL